jgi:hypothetical protein
MRKEKCIVFKTAQASKTIAYIERVCYNLAASGVLAYEKGLSAPLIEQLMELKGFQSPPTLSLLFLCVPYTQTDRFAVCACKNCAPLKIERKNYEAETKDTQSYGKAGQSHRIWQVFASQSGNQPPAP